MKIPTDLTPLGPEMAFKMPDGEVLPMWVRDSDIEPLRIAGIKSFDSRCAITSIGTQWFQCALLDGHPIPESALVNKQDRLTNGAATNWCADAFIARSRTQGGGGMIVRYERFGGLIAATKCPNGHKTTGCENTAVVGTWGCVRCPHHRSHTADTVDCAFGEEPI